MHPAYVRYRIGIALLVVALVSMFVGFPVTLVLCSGGHQALLLVSVAVLAIVSMVFMGNARDAARLVARWKKLGFGPSSTFPRTEMEKDVLRVWATNELEHFRYTARGWSDLREKAKAALEACVTEKIQVDASPAKLSKVREAILRAERRHEDASRKATMAYIKFNAAWELFSNLGMLPINPVSGKPWQSRRAYLKEEPKTDAPEAGVQPIEPFGDPPPPPPPPSGQPRSEPFGPDAHLIG